MAAKAVKVASPAKSDPAGASTQPAAEKETTATRKRKRTESETRAKESAAKKAKISEAEGSAASEQVCWETKRSERFVFF